MSRILIGSTPASGHVRPGLPIARELTARGHDVVWYTGERFKSAVERSGARHVGFTAAVDFDEADLDSQFPERASIKPGIRQLKFDLRTLFIDTIPDYVTDLRNLASETTFDAIVVESSFIAAALLADQQDLPWAVYATTPLIARSVDCAPLGFALPPLRGPLGRVRNGTLNKLTEVVFAAEQKRFEEVCTGLGFPRPDHFLLDYGVSTAPIYIQGTIPEFEYPRRDLQDTVHFVGALLPEAPTGTDLPEWWDELDEDRPVILVSQGTLKINPDLLLHPAIDALRSEDALVVVTTGGTAPEEIRGHDADNVRIERFIPFADLLPKVDVVVTNGGYGGTQQALAHGIPVVVAGVTEGKNEVAARVAWSGAGINLKTETPTSEQIRTAVRTLLDVRDYRDRARTLQARYVEHDAGAAAATLIEGVLGADSAPGRPSGPT